MVLHTGTATDVAENENDNSSFMIAGGRRFGGLGRRGGKEEEEGG